MDGRIGRVLELLQEHVLGVAGGDLLGLGDGALHALGAFGQNESGAVGQQQLAPLDAHGLGHGQRDGDAPCCRHEGQRDAGVAAGRLDNLLAGAEQSALFGIPDHRRADAALDRVGRVAALDLGQHGGTGAVGDAVEADQRRAADGERVVGEDVRHVDLWRGLLWDVTVFARISPPMSKVRQHADRQLKRG